jgi:K(+)-stimulated pyrophosphate-energized sodium pump
MQDYLLQQGKFLMILWLLIAVCIYYYFGVLQEGKPRRR